MAKVLKESENVCARRSINPLPLKKFLYTPLYSLIRIILSYIYNKFHERNPNYWCLMNSNSSKRSLSRLCLSTQSLTFYFKWRDRKYKKVIVRYILFDFISFFLLSVRIIDCKNVNISVCLSGSPFDRSLSVSLTLIVNIHMDNLSLFSWMIKYTDIIMH